MPSTCNRKVTISERLSLYPLFTLILVVICWIPLLLFLFYFISLITSLNMSNTITQLSDMGLVSPATARIFDSSPPDQPPGFTGRRNAPAGIEAGLFVDCYNIRRRQCQSSGNQLTSFFTKYATSVHRDFPDTYIITKPEDIGMKAGGKDYNQGKNKKKKKSRNTGGCYWDAEDIIKQKGTREQILKWVQENPPPFIRQPFNPPPPKGRGRGRGRGGRRGRGRGGRGGRGGRRGRGRGG
eukprot:236261_1